MKRLAAGLSLAACAALADGVTGAAPREDPPPAATSVPRLPTPGAQLAHARRLKRACIGRPSRRDLPDARERAVEAYRAVRVHHPQAHAVGAEAAFRAGELLRAAGAGARALAEFEVAWKLGANTPFRARARLEIGHVHRRARRPEPALDAYLRVASDPNAARTHRDEAWLRVGLLWREAGRLEDARRAWRRVAEHGVDPLDRIEAFDRLGRLWIDRGDLEAAAGTLDECARALADQASEETPSGARIRRALSRMRLVTELTQRIERRRTLKASGQEDRETLDKTEQLFHRILPEPVRVRPRVRSATQGPEDQVVDPPVAGSPRYGNTTTSPGSPPLLSVNPGTSAARRGRMKKTGRLGRASSSAQPTFFPGTGSGDAATSAAQAATGSLHRGWMTARRSSD